MISLLGSFTSVLSKIGYILLAIVVLMIMIMIHEFGHYTAGKIFKFKINEFSIGFGKALYTKTKKNGEVFSIRLIPLGGYCAFEGEDADGKTKGSFNSYPWWQRLIVLFSGAFFNFLSAVLFSIVLLSCVGTGYSQITSIDANSKTGENNCSVLYAGDIIYKVNGTRTTFLNGGFRTLIASVGNDGETITLTLDRVVDGRTTRMTVEVQKYDYKAVDADNNPVLDSGGNITYSKLLGVTTQNYKYNFWKSLYMAFPFACSMAWECLVIIGKIFIGKYGLRDLGGPITTINAIATASSYSMLNLILLFPLIAVNLAVFNLLPIPALDGARMVFVIIEAIRGKPIKREIEAKIHTIGLIVLFGFVILVDILQMFVF